MSKFIKFILSSSTTSFINGDLPTRIDKIEMHHIFPRESNCIKELKKLNPEVVKDVENIANITCLPSTENNFFSNDNPSIYISKLNQIPIDVLKRRLKEHGIRDIEFLKENLFYYFLEDRSK
ncbi:MAG: hypothetical protein ACRCXQ_06390 [Vagococcus fluvialis]